MLLYQKFRQTQIYLIAIAHSGEISTKKGCCIKKACIKKPGTKKSTSKSTASKNSDKKGKAGRRLFPTKEELEQLKQSKSLDKKAKEPVKAEKKERRLFPTKAELEAKLQAQNPTSSPAPEKSPATPSKSKDEKSVIKIDGEDVELEDIELEDLETLVEEAKEILEEEEKSEIRVVNVAEEAQNEENAFTLKDSEEDDAPAQTVLTAGATADPVKDYLKLIGRVPLLNAEMEVELSLQVEAGRFAEELLNSDKHYSKSERREFEQLVLYKISLIKIVL